MTYRIVILDIQLYFGFFFPFLFLDISLSHRDNLDADFKAHAL